MNDFVRREDVVEALYEAIRTDLRGTFTDSMSLAIAMAENIPSAKQNILKGKWQVTSIKGETWGICSNCNFKQKAGELNFCPNCGADMREDIPMEYFENGGI